MKLSNKIRTDKTKGALPTGTPLKPAPSFSHPIEDDIIIGDSAVITALKNLPVYVDDIDAGNNGLAVGQPYSDTSGILRIRQ